MERSRPHHRGEVREVGMMVAGLVIMAGGENTTPVTTISTAVVMVVIDMVAMAAVVGTTIEVTIETGDMMGGTMLDRVIIVTTTRADILTTVDEAAGVMIMKGGEMSRGEDVEADLENAGREGGGATRDLLGPGAEATTVRPNAGIVTVGAASQAEADRAVAREVKAQAEAAVKVWIASIGQFVALQISRRRAMMVADRPHDQSQLPDRLHLTPFASVPVAQA